MKAKRYERVVCKDGFSVSIQASAGNYSEPRDDDGPYVSVELGYPSEPDHLIMKWADTPNDPTKTVYGWVPSEVVIELLQKHGGWISGELPPMVIGRN